MDTEDDSVTDCPSSRMNTNPSCDKVLGMAVSSGSIFMFKSSNREDPFFASGWDSLGSLSHTGNFGAPSMVSQNDFGNPSFPVVMGGHYASDSGLVEMVPKLPCFGNFSEIVGSFSLPDCGQIAPTSRPPNFNPKNLRNKEGSTENSSRDGMHSEECQISEEGGVGASQNGKRKRMASESQSPFNSNLSAQGDPSGNCSGRLKKNGEKKRNVEQNTSPNLQSKQNAKIDKGNSNSGDGPKENYIHARARRGQATNSHSLAERVRRERISERMRLLQELVPGCNKITGKAVMLDEIINYVQSLQQQVELLSMKLATVNPELNIKVDRILSKEILHPQGGNTPTLGFVAGLNGYQYSQSFPRGSLPGISCTAPPFPMPQVWDSDHQNLLQMGFDSNAAVNNLVHNGCSKLEL